MATSQHPHDVPQYPPYNTGDANGYYNNQTQFTNPDHMALSIPKPGYSKSFNVPYPYSRLNIERPSYPVPDMSNKVEYNPEWTFSKTRSSPLGGSNYHEFRSPYGMSAANTPIFASDPNNAILNEGELDDITTEAHLSTIVPPFGHRFEKYIRPHSKRKQECMCLPLMNVFEILHLFVFLFYGPICFVVSILPPDWFKDQAKKHNLDPLLFYFIIVLISYCSYIIMVIASWILHCQLCMCTRETKNSTYMTSCIDILGYNPYRSNVTKAFQRLWCCSWYINGSQTITSPQTILHDFEELKNATPHYRYIVNCTYNAENPTTSFLKKHAKFTVDLPTVSRFKDISLSTAQITEILENIHGPKRFDTYIANRVELRGEVVTSPEQAYAQLLFEEWLSEQYLSASNESGALFEKVEVTRQTLLLVPRDPLDSSQNTTTVQTSDDQYPGFEHGVTPQRELPHQAFEKQQITIDLGKYRILKSFSSNSCPSTDSKSLTKISDDKIDKTEQYTFRNIDLHVKKYVMFTDVYSWFWSMLCCLHPFTAVIMLGICPGASIFIPWHVKNYNADFTVRIKSKKYVHFDFSFMFDRAQFGCLDELLLKYPQNPFDYSVQEDRLVDYYHPSFNSHKDAIPVAPSANLLVTNIDKSIEHLQRSNCDIELYVDKCSTTAIQSVIHSVIHSPSTCTNDALESTSIRQLYYNHITPTTPPFATLPVPQTLSQPSFSPSELKHHAETVFKQVPPYKPPMCCFFIPNPRFCRIGFVGLGKLFWTFFKSFPLYFLFLFILRQFCPDGSPMADDIDKLNINLKKIIIAYLWYIYFQLPVNGFFPMLYERYLAGNIGNITNNSHHYLVLIAGRWSWKRHFASLKMMVNCCRVKDNDAQFQEIPSVHEPSLETSRTSYSSDIYQNFLNTVKMPSNSGYIRESAILDRITRMEKATPKLYLEITCFHYSISLKIESRPPFISQENLHHKFITHFERIEVPILQSYIASEDGMAFLKQTIGYSGDKNDAMGIPTTMPTQMRDKYVGIKYETGFELNASQTQMLDLWCDVLFKHYSRYDEHCEVKVKYTTIPNDYPQDQQQQQKFDLNTISSHNTNNNTNNNSTILLTTAESAEFNSDTLQSQQQQSSCILSPQLPDKKQKTLKSHNFRRTNRYRFEYPSALTMRFTPISGDAAIEALQENNEKVYNLISEPLQLGRFLKNNTIDHFRTDKALQNNDNEMPLITDEDVLGENVGYIDNKPPTESSALLSLSTNSSNHFSDAIHTDLDQEPLYKTVGYIPGDLSPEKNIAPTIQMTPHPSTLHENSNPLTIKRVVIFILTWFFPSADHNVENELDWDTPVIDHWFLNNITYYSTATQQYFNGSDANYPNRREGASACHLSVCCGVNILARMLSYIFIDLPVFYWLTVWFALSPFVHLIWIMESAVVTYKEVRVLHLAKPEGHPILDYYYQRHILNTNISTTNEQSQKQSRKLIVNKEKNGTIIKINPFTRIVKTLSSSLISTKPQEDKPSTVVQSTGNND